MAGPAAGEKLEDANEILYAISAYSPAIWNHFRAENLELREALGYAVGADERGTSRVFLVQTLDRRMRLLSKYLTSGLGLSVDENRVRSWSELVRPAEEALAESLDETIDPRSATAHLLRCLPFVEDRPTNAETVTDWLDRFVHFVMNCDSATRALVAGYGQRWDVIVDTVIPVDVPTKIQLRTKRPWHDGAVPQRWPWHLAGSITQRVMVGDAQSGHAEVHLADHDVRVKAPPRVRNPSGRNIGVPSLSALRWTDDKVSIYVAGRDAPAFVDLRLRLGLHWPTRLFLWLLLVATGASLPLLAAVGNSDSIRNSATLLVLPLAGAILLARPATGVSQRLQHRLRVLLLVVVAMAALAAVLGPAERTIGPDAKPAPTDSTPADAPPRTGVSPGA